MYYLLRLINNKNKNKHKTSAIFSKLIKMAKFFVNNDHDHNG